MELRGLHKVREEDRLLFVKQKQYRNVYLPMARGKPWVVLEPESGAEVMSDRHFSLTGRCDYYTSREILASYTFSIILQKGSPLLHAINSRLQAVTQGGLYTHWVKAALPNASYCRHPPSIITVKDSLNLANLWGVFSVLAGGLGVSFLAFLCELITSPHREL